MFIVRFARTSASVDIMHLAFKLKEKDWKH